MNNLYFKTKLNDKNKLIVKARKSALKRELKVVRDLGIGNTALVQLVVNKRTNKKYALKTIKKDIINIDEIEILLDIKTADPMFIINLQKIFVGKNKIHLMLNLWTDSLYNLQASIEITQDLLKEFAFQMIKGLQELAQLSIVHRDFWLGNVLFKYTPSAKFIYSICISDFGSASKYVPGTPLSNTSFPHCELITAPELSGGSYGPAIDIWALGVNIFHLQHGKNGNFDVLDEMQDDDFAEKYLSQSIGYHDLLKGLLSIDPNTRSSLEDALNSSFFNTFIETSISPIFSATGSDEAENSADSQGILESQEILSDFEKLKDSLPEKTLTASNPLTASNSTLDYSESTDSQDGDEAEGDDELEGEDAYLGLQRYCKTLIDEKMELNAAFRREKEEHEKERDAWFVERECLRAEVLRLEKDVEVEQASKKISFWKRVCRLFRK